LVAKPVGKAAEGIGQATDCKEIKVVGQGTQDAVDEPLEKIGEGAKEIGEEFKKGFEDLGDKIDEVFK
jgi:uncharacterized protein with HEPN domain